MDPNNQTSPQVPQMPAPNLTMPPAPNPAQNVPMAEPTPLAQPTPVAAPSMPVMPPPPAKKGGGLKFVIIGLVVVLVLSLVIGAVVILMPQGTTDKTGEETKDEGPGAREHEAQEYPDFVGVEIGEDTVAFNKVDESFRIRYKEQIFHEQDTGEFTPREVFPETKDDFKWYGLVDAPDSKLFSFKAPVTYQSFIFIMRSNTEEKYTMYRFQNNQLSLLSEFTKDRVFYAPIIDDFSLGGNFVSIKLFTCPTCTDGTPEVLLYHIETGETKNLGQVSHFAWGKDDASYEYKEYKEGVDPDTQVLRKNEFFVESVDILDP